MIPNSKRTKFAHETLAAQAYSRLKADIFNFHFLPGERFSENEVSERLKMSRTPIREALYRLRREGYVDVLLKHGWQVAPLDFEKFEMLYDVRGVLESAAVEHLCAAGDSPLMQSLRDLWMAPEVDRIADISTLSQHDEQFHALLVRATGNTEMARIHHDITERIRIIRRLEFSKEARIEVTYTEHAAILCAIRDGNTDIAKKLLQAHIAVSKAEVKNITIQMLHKARTTALSEGA
jgi:DNA-binding GntR family transcriptional regulator